MPSLLRTILHALRNEQPRLVCNSNVWAAGVRELRRRAGGKRESGAFLLGTEREGGQRIKQFLFYDDVDPSCFKRGFVEFDGRRFGTVWKICRDTRMSVVADVHVHPFGYQQSSSDRQNPMIAKIGHTAVILPDYARGKCLPAEIGVYEYLGNRRWKDRSAHEHVLHIGWWPQ